MSSNPQPGDWQRWLDAAVAALARAPALLMPGALNHGLLGNLPSCIPQATQPAHGSQAFALLGLLGDLAGRDRLHVTEKVWTLGLWQKQTLDWVACQTALRDVPFDDALRIRLMLHALFRLVEDWVRSGGATGMATTPAGALADARQWRDAAAGQPLMPFWPMRAILGAPLGLPAGAWNEAIAEMAQPHAWRAGTLYFLHRLSARLRVRQWHPDIDPAPPELQAFHLALAELLTCVRCRPELTQAAAGIAAVLRATSLCGARPPQHIALGGLVSRLPGCFRPFDGKPSISSAQVSVMLSRNPSAEDTRALADELALRVALLIRDLLCVRPEAQPPIPGFTPGRYALLLAMQDDEAGLYDLFRDGRVAGLLHHHLARSGRSRWAELPGADACALNHVETWPVA